MRADRNEKKAGLAVLIADKIDFKTKNAKKRHYIPIKGSAPEKAVPS